jgi:hypothetical protein
MNVSAPEQDRRFSAELQYREDEIALQAMAQFGDPIMQRVAWRVFARNSTMERMREIRELVGEVPPSWMEGIYQRYTPKEVKELVIYNALSKLDDREVTDYIEGVPLPRPPTNDVLIAQAVREKWALEDLLVSTISVAESGGKLHITTSIENEDIDEIVYNYNADRDDVIALLEILSLKSRNESKNRIHLYNASWVSMYAPWLILLSSDDLQLAFFQHFDCYRLELLYGARKDIDRLLNIVDPTRLALSQYFTNAKNNV